MLDEVEGGAKPMQEAIAHGLIEVQDAVRSAFGWSVSSDLNSARAMAEEVQLRAQLVTGWSAERRKKALEGLREKLIQAKQVVILGAAVTEQEVASITGDEYQIIAADGSVGVLEDFTRLACVVTDFDGGIHLNRAAQQGATLVAHAHGDNQDRWLHSLGSWSEYSAPPALILSHQTPQSIDGMYNFGGFTDGDRAVCFALAMGVEKKRIRLVGFSLRVVGQWSATTVSEQKLRKLVWMNRILKSIGMNGAVVE